MTPEIVHRHSMPVPRYTSYPTAQQFTGATVEKVLELEPDRIAIFGYAHLPDRFRHQTLIDAAYLQRIAARALQ